jgi:hypothetical protein
MTRRINEIRRLKAEQLFQQAETRTRLVADVEQRRLEEMRANSDRLRKLREERDAMTFGEKTHAAARPSPRP